MPTLDTVGQKAINRRLAQLELDQLKEVAGTHTARPQRDRLARCELELDAAADDYLSERPAVVRAAKAEV